MKNIKKLLLFTIILFMNFALIINVDAETQKNYLDENIGSIENMGIYNYLSDVGDMDLTNVTEIVFRDMTGSNFTFSDEELTAFLDISKDKDKTVMANLSNNVLYIDFTGILVLNSNSINLFSNFSNVTKITGLNYLNTSEVINMKNMFYGLINVSELDLSSFDTSSVSNMSAMFYGMTNLETIYVSKKWDTSNVISYQYMFYNNIKLKGQNGTEYNKNYNELSLAKMDTSNAPGYLTKKLTISVNWYILEDDYIFIGQDDFNLYNINVIDETLVFDNNKLKIYYQDELIKTLDVVRIVSNKFQFVDYKYLYIGLHNISDVTLEVINGTYKIENEKLILYHKDKVIGTYDFMSYSSDYYDLTKDYIYVGNGEFDISKINSKNAGIGYDESGTKLRIYYSPRPGMGNIFKEYPIIKVSSEIYDLTKDYIYSGVDFYNGYIKLVNAKYKEEDNHYNIYYGDELVKSYELAYIKCNSSYSISDHNELALNVWPPQNISGVNVTYEIINDILYIYYKGELMETYHYVTLSSDYYDLSSEHIYLGNESFDVSKINVSGATIHIGENYFDVKSQYGFNRRYYLIYVSSDVYDLTKDYVYVGNNNIDLNELSAVNGEFRVNGSKLNLHWCYGDEYCGNVIKSFDILSLSSNYYDLSKEYIYITSSNISSSLISASENLILKEENNKLNIYYNNLLLDSYDVVKLNTGGYHIYDNKYIYTRNDKFNINNIYVTNGTMELVKNEDIENSYLLNIYYNNTLIITYDIVSFFSDKYDLNKYYILVINEEFDIDKIQFIGCAVKVENNKLNIYYKDILLTSFNLIQISSDKYDLSKDYIFTDTEAIDFTKINVTNGSMLTHPNQIFIYDSENFLVKQLDIITLSSSYYNLTSDYIYLGIDNFKFDCIDAGMGILSVEDDKLNLYYKDEILKSYDLVRVSSSKYNFYSKYIYLGLNEIDINDINLSNGTIKIENNKLNFYYNENLIDSYDLVSISSLDYDLTESYIFVGINEFDMSKINVTNARLEYEDEKVFVAYEDWSLEEFSVIKVSSNVYDVQNDKIHIGDHRANRDRVIATNAIVSDPEDGYFKILFDNKVIHQYLIEANIISISSPCARYEFTLNEPETITIPIEFNPGEFIYNKTLTWTSSDENVAIVDSNGTVTPVGAGYAIITATTHNGKTSGSEIIVIGNISYSSTGYVGIYTGDERTIKVDVKTPNTQVSYSLDGNYYYSDLPTFVNPGKYKVYYMISAGDYYNIAYGNEEVAIYGINELDEQLLIKNDILVVNCFNQTFMDIKLKMKIFSEVTYNFLHYDKDLTIDEGETIRTGDYLKIKFDIEGDSYFQYRLAVLGDANGDGEISPLDYVKIKNHIMGTNLIESDAYLIASDVNSDDEISPLDYVRVKNYIMNGAV